MMYYAYSMAMNLGIKKKIPAMFSHFFIVIIYVYFTLRVTCRMAMAMEQLNA